VTDYYKNRDDTIIRMDDSGLLRQVWRLALPWGTINHSNRLRLSEYLIQGRESKRHAWKDRAAYPGVRWSNIQLRRDEVDVPDDVLAEFLARISIQGVA